MTHRSDAIWVTGNETTGSWNSGVVRMKAHMPADWQTKYLRATPARESAEDMLEALRALMDLNDNGGPFGGEIYQDRIDRAWDSARAAIAKATGGAA